MCKPVWGNASQALALRGRLSPETEPAGNAAHLQLISAQEGYALDWSPVTQGLLGAGDCSGSITLLEPDSAGRWAPSEPLRVS